MYRKILVGYTDDEQGREALSLARVLAEPTGVELLVATEVTGTHPWDTNVSDRRREAKLDIERAVATLAPDLVVSVRALVGPSTAGTLAKVAEDEGADLIVLGSTHRGRVGQALIGTTASQALSSAACPIVIAPHGYTAPAMGPGTIAVAFDGSPGSEEALRWATGVAIAFDAVIQLIDIVPQDSHELPRTDIRWPEVDFEKILDRLCTAAQARVDEALREVPDKLALPGKVLFGDPAEWLRHETKHGVDLLVAGSRGRSPLRRMLLGSVCSELMRTSPCPFVVVPSSTTTQRVRVGTTVSAQTPQLSASTPSGQTT